MSINSGAVRKGLLGAVLCILILVEPPLLVALTGVIRPITKIVGALSDKKIIDLSMFNANNVTKGHSNESRIAHEDPGMDFEVEEELNDGTKRMDTDIDIILRKNGKIFAIEAKNYDQFSNLDMLRSDMDTLVEYKKFHKGENIIPVFTITNRPTNPQREALMFAEAQKRGVQLLFGTPLEQIEQIKLLELII